MDSMADSVNQLVNWYKNGYNDSNFATLTELEASNMAMNLFVKLVESLRKTSLARREEICNHTIISLKKSFILAVDLEFTPANCISCFNLVIFSMVDDLHEKMLEYSRRENAERETRSMEGTLKLSMELLAEVYLQYLKTISESANFGTFWLGILRRMDTCMNADFGEYGESSLQDIVPDLLRKMNTSMKDNEILVQKDGDDLWEIPYIQIQWIAPPIKEELFPEEL